MPFKPGYFRLLSYGGSARPAEVLREIDIDITDPEFWQGASTWCETCSTSCGRSRFRALTAPFAARPRSVG